MGRGGKNSREAACRLFIVSEGSGSVVNGMNAVASVRLLNLSEPVSPQRPLWSPSRKWTATIRLWVTQRIPLTLPSFSAEVEEEAINL